jgi:hypothetical protein
MQRAECFDGAFGPFARNFKPPKVEDAVAIAPTPQAAFIVCRATAAPETVCALEMR